MDQRVVIPTAAQAVADVLREEVLSRSDDDTFLGSEDDLLRRLGVSRPTLRQAVRLLEHESLLTVKRGVNGGFFARKPDAHTVSQAATIYLRSKDVTLRDLRRARLMVEAQCVRDATANLDADAERELSATVENLHEPGERRMRSAALDFHRLIGKLSRNPVNALFLEVTLDLTYSSASPTRFTNEKRGDLSNAHERIVEAMLDGDAELAARRMTSHLESALDWMETGHVE